MLFLQNRPCPRYMLRAPLTHTHRRPVLREFCAHRPDSSPEYTITRHSRQRATGPKRKRPSYVPPARRRASPPLVSFLHTPRACPSIHVRRHYPIALHAPRSRLGRLRHNPSPQPAQHNDSTVHTTQNTTNSHSPRHPQHAIHDGNASIRAAVSSPCPPDSTATTALPLLPRSDGLPKSRESLNLSSYSLLSPHASGST